MVLQLKTTVVTLVSLCLAAKIFVITFWTSSYLSPPKKVTSALVQEAKSFHSIPNAGFVFLGLGAQANQMNCPAAIESLVRYGGWDGHIYLVTDQPRCFDTEEIISNSKMPDKSKFHLVTVNDNFATGGIDWEHSNVGFRKSRIMSKSMKGKLFELIPDPNIEVLAYVDCDMIFTQESCPKQIIDSSYPWKENMLRLSHIGLNATTGELSDLHSGSFVAHRNYSSKILKMWNERALNTNDGLDRVSLIQLYKDHYLPQEHTYSPQEMHERKAILGSESHARPNQLTFTSLLKSRHHKAYDSSNWFEKFIDPDVMNTPETVPCMVHISKARCDRIGREKVQSFVNHFNLKTYKDTYKYCAHSLIQPLENGWFPFGYLPFCPKLETLL